MRTFRTFCGKPLQGNPHPSCPGAPTAGAPGPGVGSKGRSRGTRGTRGRGGTAYPAGCPETGPTRHATQTNPSRRPQGHQGTELCLLEVPPVPSSTCTQRVGRKGVFPGHLVVSCSRWVRKVTFITPNNPPTLDRPDQPRTTALGSDQRVAYDASLRLSLRRAYPRTRAMHGAYAAA